MDAEQESGRRLDNVVFFINALRRALDATVVTDMIVDMVNITNGQIYLVAPTL